MTKRLVCIAHFNHKSVSMPILILPLPNKHHVLPFGNDYINQTYQSLTFLRIACSGLEETLVRSHEGVFSRKRLTISLHYANLMFQELFILVIIHP